MTDRLIIMRRRLVGASRAGATASRAVGLLLLSWGLWQVAMHHQALQETLMASRLAGAAITQEVGAVLKSARLREAAPSLPLPYQTPAPLLWSLRKGRKQGRGTPGRHVLVVEDGECLFRPLKAKRRCSMLDEAYSDYCEGFHLDSHYHHGYIGAFRLLQPYMSAVGYPNYLALRMDDTKLEQHLRRADIVVTIASLVPKLISRTPGSFVVIERVDSASICEDNYYDITSRRILAVMKHTSLHPVTRNNDDPLLHGRHHYIQLDASLASSGKKRWPPLSPSSLKKVHTMVPQVMRFRFPLECGGKRHYLHLLPTLLGPASPVAPQDSPGVQIDTNSTTNTRGLMLVRPLEERTIDVAFLGGTQDHDVLKKHRKQAVKAIKAMGRKHQRLHVLSGLQKTDTVAEFYDILRNVRFFVSPYGYGEFTNKDYEAILCGCVLVKPLAHQLTAFPNIYKPGVTTVDVKGDFSDLEAKVMPLLGELSRAQGIADRALEQLRKFSNPEVMAGKFANLLSSRAS